ncbi:MAG: hypothetical protein RI580_09335 [Halothece sp. Uz-M2-17]|nr:hypothetical protein [Halothece sp. Uz-M2-17]
MENITIQVDSETAQAYRNSDPEKKRKIQSLLNIMLRKTVNEKPLLEIMQEASEEATANGMTPEILESILLNTVTSYQLPVKQHAM